MFTTKHDFNDPCLFQVKVTIFHIKRSDYIFRPKIELPEELLREEEGLNREGGGSASCRRSKSNSNNNVIKMHELTEEDLLNLQVTGEKLLTTGDEPRRSPKQVNQNNRLPASATGQVSKQASKSMEVEEPLKKHPPPPPPPYPNHLLNYNDATAVARQNHSVSVIDKPPLPPQALPPRSLPPHTLPSHTLTSLTIATETTHNPVYISQHNSEEISNRLTNSNPPTSSTSHTAASPPLLAKEQQQQQQQEVHLMHAIETQKTPRLGEITERSATEIVYPWRAKKHQILSSRLLARQQQLHHSKDENDAQASYEPLHSRVESDPLSELTAPPVTRSLPKRVYKYVDYIDSGALSDSEMGMSTVYRRRRRDDALRPSLTFVGRRIESPAGGGTNTSTNVNSAQVHAYVSHPAKTVFSHLIKPDARMSPITERGSPLLFVSAPPSGLRKIPAQGVEPTSVKIAESTNEVPHSITKATVPPQVVLSAPSPSPHEKPPVSATTISGPEMSSVPEETSSGNVQESGATPATTASFTNNRSPQNEGGDHSPRPEDIYFSAAAPDLVDIPMPQVKEMINDLNRRLEAIAAQQPKIAEPPTAQELGLSFEGMLFCNAYKKLLTFMSHVEDVLKM